MIHPAILVLAACLAQPPARDVPIIREEGPPRPKPTHPATTIDPETLRALVDRYARAYRGQHFHWPALGYSAWDTCTGGSTITVIAPADAYVAPPIQLTPTDALKRSMDAAENPPRLAGSMAQEMLREQIEAKKKAEGWVNGEPPPPTPPDQIARSLCDHARFTDALPHVRAHLAKHADDRAAQRWLALALLGAKRTEDAIAVVRGIYRTDPLIARTPIDLDATGLKSQAQDLFLAAVAHANKTQASSAWLTAAVIAQAQARGEQARTCLAKARNAGLEADIHDPFAAALDEQFPRPKASRSMPSQGRAR